MTITDLIHIFKKNIAVLLAVPALAAVVMAGVSYLAMEDRYTSTASMYVLASENASSGAGGTLQTNLNSSQMIGSDVSDLLKSAKVQEQTASALGIPSLAGYALDISFGDSTRTVRLSVTGEDPRMAADIANKLVENVSSVAQETIGVQSVNLVDEAVASSVPSGPNRPLYIVLAALAGFILAYVAVVVKNVLNARLADIEELEGRLSLPVLARIPRVRKTRGRDMDDSGLSEKDRKALSGAVDGLVANLRFAGSHRPMRSIVVTSSVAGEGKSTCAVNLAKALAKGGSTVLLLECDSYHRTLGKMLGVAAKTGLYSVALGRIEAGDAIEKTDFEGLSLLDCEPEIPCPSNVFASAQFSELITRVEARFDYVVIDTPPLDAFVDAAVIGTLADATLVVARWDFVKLDAVRSALEQLKKARATVVGAVVNCLPSSFSYGHYYADRASGGSLNAAPHVIEPETDAELPASPAAPEPSPEEPALPQQRTVAPVLGGAAAVPHGAHMPNTPDSTTQFLVDAGYLNAGAAEDSD